jgi:outer membrane protein OmpA-like peptidoglycan-associated protein/dienelactone hydrolase
MAPVKPMLDGVELPQAQRIAAEDEAVLAQHGVPALEGDFLQDLGRRATRIALAGVMAGPEAAGDLKGLREKFRGAEAVPFVSDIATATSVDQVLIEELGVRELAGRPARFEYALALRELIPPPAVTTEVPPIIPPPPVLDEVGTLVVEVIVTGQPGFDFSLVKVTVDGTDDKSAAISRTLANRAGNVWTEASFPPGSYTAKAVVDEPQMSGSAAAAVRPGQTTQATITLTPGALIAHAFVVHYWFDKAFVEPCLRELLRRVAAYADAHPDEKLVIVGHTDLVGSGEYNQSLSERRARGCYAYLTFGRDHDGAVAEWNELRKPASGALPSIHDHWGTREVQYILQDLGYYSGNIDEIAGPATQAAISNFQTDSGLSPATGALDEATWKKLVEAYMEQDSLKLPEVRFLKNANPAKGCDGGIVKWLGAGEQAPVRNTQDAWRPNRRTELLFVKTDHFPCAVAQPKTFDLPAPGAGGTTWCLGPGDDDKRYCFATRDPQQQDKWLVTPAEPGKVHAQGTITLEDGTPVANARYTLLAPDGQFLHTDPAGKADLGERPSGPQRGRGIPNRAGADGSFSYPDETLEGVYILEILGLTAPQVARSTDELPEDAIGNVVCLRIDPAHSAGRGAVVQAGPVPRTPHLTAPVPAVAVKRSYTNPERLPITLQVSHHFRRSGTLERSGNTSVIHLFDAPTGGTEIQFDGTDNVFPGGRLTNGVQLFAESDTVSGAVGDYVLTLTLAAGATPVGPPATLALTAVLLTLDICAPRLSPRVDPVPLPQANKLKPGRTVQVREADFSNERAALIVEPPQPTGFSGTLTLSSFGAGGPARVEAFAVEAPAAGQTPAAGTIPTSAIPPGGLKLFAEGTSVSAAVRDTGFRLGIQGLANECDRVELTVLGDLSQPGPYPVGEKEYQRSSPFNVPPLTEALSDLACFDSSIPPGQTQAFPSFPVNVHALVRYPAQSAGANQPVSTGLDSYPLVVLAHGNHRSLLPSGARVESFRGLEYLARHLASYGYVAVSIDLEDLNLDLSAAPPTPLRRDPAIAQRGHVILEHIREMATLNGADPQLQGKVDLGQIALIGHSRGGEAVVSAQKTNLDEARGHQVKAVVSIAPTDFLGIVHASTPYLAIYGSADNDLSRGQALRLYDRATTLKAALFVYGAIHNRFSTNADWLAHLDSNDGRMIAESDHLNIARGYSLGFLEMVLRGQRDHAALLDRNQRPNSVTAVEIHHQFQHPTRLTVDNFEQGALDRTLPLPPQLVTRAQTNSLGGAVTVGGLAAPTGLTNARTEASLRETDLPSFFHDTVGAMIAWNAASGTYTTSLGSRDVTTFQVLSLRVCQRFDSARNFNPPDPAPPLPPAPGAPMDLFVRLVDAAGQAATVGTATVTTIPYPYKRSDVRALTKSVLKTIRLPLAAFTAANGALNLSAVAAVVLELRPNATGEIAVDDLELSN